MHPHDHRPLSDDREDSGGDAEAYEDHGGHDADDDHIDPAQQAASADDGQGRYPLRRTNRCPTTSSEAGGMSIGSAADETGANDLVTALDEASLCRTHLRSPVPIST